MDRGVWQGMVIHSSTFAWRIPWTEEPGGIQSMGQGSKELDMAERLTLSLSSVNNAARTFSQDWNPGLSESKIHTLFNIMQSSLERKRKREVLHNYIINKSFSRQIL